MRQFAHRTKNKFAAREPLADVVVGHALQGQGHALSGKGAEGLSCRTAHMQPDVRLQFGLPAAQQCQLARHPCAKTAILVLHFRVVLERLARDGRRERGFHPRIVDRGMIFRTRISLSLPVQWSIAGTSKHRLQIEVAVGPHLMQQVRAPDGRLQRRQSQCSQHPLQVFGDIKEEANHVLRLAAEFGPQIGALRRNSRRTGVEMALTRHVAAY